MTHSLPDSIGLRLPEMWSEFPLDQDDFNGYLQQLVREIGDDVPRADLRQLEVFLAGARDLALGANVVLASGFVDLESADESGQLIAGSVFVSVLRRDELGTSVPLTTDILLASLSERPDENEQSFKIDEIEPPTKTCVAGRDVVKLLRLIRSKSLREAGPKLFAQTIFAPVADGEGVVVLQFGTPNVTLASDFSELFDAIAETLRVLASQDPTFEGGLESE